MQQNQTRAILSPHIALNKWGSINLGLSLMDSHDASLKISAKQAGIKRCKSTSPSHRLLWQTLILLLLEELNNQYRTYPDSYLAQLNSQALSFSTNREQLRQMLAKLNKDTNKGTLVSLPTINNLLDRLIEMGLVSKLNNGRKNFTLSIPRIYIFFNSLIKSLEQSENPLFGTINKVNTSKGCETVSASLAEGRTDSEISTQSDADNIEKVKNFRSEANLTDSALSDKKTLEIQSENIALQTHLRLRGEKTRKLAALLWAQAKSQLWSERTMPAARAHYAEEMLHAHLQNIVERFELEYTNRIKNYISTNAKYLAASEKKRTELRIAYAKNQPNRSIEEAYILVSNALELQRRNALQKGYTMVEPVTYLTANYGMDKALHYAMKDRLATQRFANRSFNPKAAKSIAHFNAKQLIKRALIAVTKKLLERSESYPAFCVFEKSYTQLIEWLRSNQSLDTTQKAEYAQALKSQVAHIFGNIKAFTKLQF